MRDTYKKALRDGAKETIKGLLRQPVTPEGYPGRMAELVVLSGEEEANREKSRRTDPASGDYADLHDEWLMIQWEIQDLEDDMVEEEFFA